MSRLLATSLKSQFSENACGPLLVCNLGSERQWSGKRGCETVIRRLTQNLNHQKRFHRLKTFRFQARYNADVAHLISSEAIVPFRFGGHVALDFVNTVDSWVRPVTRDYIDDFEKLVGWARQVGLIDDGSAKHILRLSSLKRAMVAHTQAVEFRQILVRVFGAIIDGLPQHDADIATLNSLLKEAHGRQNFIFVSDKFEWVWTSSPDTRSPILKIALTVGDLLGAADLTRLKRCPGPDGCGWLFLDESRNRSRKWCSMEYCGSFAKARRFAESHRPS